jgi:hypothetical protein
VCVLLKLLIFLSKEFVVTQIIKRMPSKQTWVLAQDLIRVIFEDMDPVWLRSMWEIGGSTCADMIEILMFCELC